MKAFRPSGVSWIAGRIWMVWNSTATTTTTEAERTAATATTTTLLI